MSVKPIFPYSAMMNINFGQKEVAYASLGLQESEKTETNPPTESQPP